MGPLSGGLMRRNVLMRPCRRLAGSWTLQLAVSAAIAAGQSSVAQSTIKVNLVATDRAGAGIADLRTDDLRVFDDGMQQPAGPLKLERDRRTRSSVILFDLMDLSVQQQAYATNQLKHSLAKAGVAVPLGLYLLVPDGSLYPVQALKEIGRASCRERG